MASVEKSIEVDVPLHTAYNQWTQFEEFPRFMEGIREVKQLDDKRLYWHAEIGGQDKEWEAEITSQVPDQRIAWRSIDGAENAGIVTFHQVDNDKTRVDLRIDYDTDGVIESIGSALGAVSSRVEGDLERFKDFVESRGQETGAWRGQIHGGDVSGKGSTMAGLGNVDSGTGSLSSSSDIGSSSTGSSTGSRGSSASGSSIGGSRMGDSSLSSGSSLGDGTNPGDLGSDDLRRRTP